MHTQSQADDLRHNPPPDAAQYNALYNPLKRDGNRYQAWEIGLGVTSLGLLTGGVLLLVYGAPAKPSAASLSLGVEPGGARAACSFAF
jgi:hypothetical protein